MAIELLDVGSVEKWWDLLVPSMHAENIRAYALFSRMWNCVDIEIFLLLGELLCIIWPLSYIAIKDMVLSYPRENTKLASRLLGLMASINPTEYTFILTML